MNHCSLNKDRPILPCTVCVISVSIHSFMNWLCGSVGILISRTIDRILEIRFFKDKWCKELRYYRCATKIRVQNTANTLRQKNLYTTGLLVSEYMQIDLFEKYVGTGRVANHISNQSGCECALEILWSQATFHHFFKSEKKNRSWSDYKQTCPIL